MAFIQRVLGYLANELLVNRLANSTTFQRIAVKTDTLASELRQASAKNIEDVAGKTKALKEVFKTELKKELDKLPKK